MESQPRKPPLTLATGRRSRYECLSPASHEKRRLRRIKDLEAANRFNGRQKAYTDALSDKINTLEAEEAALMQTIHALTLQKVELEARLRLHQNCGKVVSRGDVRVNTYHAAEQAQHAAEQAQHIMSGVATEATYIDTLTDTQYFVDDYADLDSMLADVRHDYV